MSRNPLMALIGVAVLVTGCATAHVRVARESAGGSTRFERVAVPPFANGTGSELPAGAGENVAGAVVARLQKEHAGAFKTVTTTPHGEAGELVVKGTIKQYNPGSKALRFILIGLGAGGLGLDVTLVDGANGQTIEQFSTSGSIVAGGVAGASMGIEDMVNSAAKKVAVRVARFGVPDDKP